MLIVLALIVLALIVLALVAVCSKYSWARCRLGFKTTPWLILGRDLVHFVGPTRQVNKTRGHRTKFQCSKITDFTYTEKKR